MDGTIFRQNESSYDEELCLKTIFKSKRENICLGFFFSESLTFLKISYMKFEVNQMATLLTSLPP